MPFVHIFHSDSFSIILWCNKIYRLWRLKICVESKHLASADDPGLLVVADALLEEVCLPLQRNHLHKVEWVLHVVELGVPEGDEQAVRAELNVLHHEVRVHPDEPHREGVGDELLLDVDRLADDVVETGLRELVLEVVAVEQAREVAVEPLVARDELVAEGQAGHHAALLEPEDRAEAAAEEDALDRGEADEALGEGLRRVDPLDRPLRLPLHAGDGLHRVEEVVLVLLALDVRVNENGVHLRVDVLDRDLEPVEAAHLGDLDVAHEARGEVLEDDAVRRGEERENVLDEVALVVVELVLPLGDVLGEVDLLDGPEGRLGLLVLLPDVWVFDGEEHVAAWVVFQHGLIGVLRYGILGSRALGL